MLVKIYMPSLSQSNYFYFTDHVNVIQKVAYRTCVMPPDNVRARKMWWEFVVINAKPTISIWTLETPKDAKPASVTDTVSAVRMRKVSEPRSLNLVSILILMDGVFKINTVRA